MAERSKPKPAAAKRPARAAAAPAERLPAELLRRRTAVFLSMTQGAGKPMQYPGPPKR